MVIASAGSIEQNIKKTRKTEKHTLLFFEMFESLELKINC